MTGTKYPIYLYIYIYTVMIRIKNKDLFYESWQIYE